MAKAILVKRLPFTSTKPARFVASDEDGNKVVVSAENATMLVHFTSTRTSKRSINPWRYAAEVLCAQMGWSGRLVQGSIRGYEVFVFDGREFEGGSK